MKNGFRELPLERGLLEKYEYPVALAVEVTKKGVTLSKLRYLKTVGQAINETLRCPSIEVYCHVSPSVDPHMEKGHGRPMGIDWIFRFDVRKDLFREVVRDIRKGRRRINTNNPNTREMARHLIQKIETRKNPSYKMLNPYEQGLVLEPYCEMIFERAGRGPRDVFQNVEVVNRESALLVRDPEPTIYYPKPSPTMEIDLLVITDVSTLPSILMDLKNYGFERDGGE